MSLFSYDIVRYKVVLFLNETSSFNDIVCGGDVYNNGPRREKTGLRGFRPGLTQTDLFSHRSRLEA